MTTRMRIAQMDREELLKRCEDGSMYADFVPIGKWIKRIYNEDRLGYECDQCGELSYNATNFCPFCGADLREGDKRIMASAEFDIGPIVSKIVSEVKSELKKPDWIPVSERLPEKEGRYLTYIINRVDSRLQYIMTCDYLILKNLDYSWCPDDETASDHVVAWMPLPEPYKGDVE